jgi:hypothetical protein
MVTYAFESMFLRVRIKRGKNDGLWLVEREETEGSVSSSAPESFG